MSERIAEAVRDGAARLDEAGCETPRLDAEVLLASVLGVGRERLVLDGRQALGAPALDRFSALVARRAAREPVAYIIGAKDFRRISLAVDRRVLIPRPETELLVEAGLGLCDGARVVDVGTGSGAVALALKDERPDLEVVGVDAFVDAVEVARSNGARLGLDVEFVVADLLEGVPGRFDAVLANLPYVAVGDRDVLAPEIAVYEPARALYSGADGLELIRRLVPMLDGIPFVALEIGSGQAAVVSKLLSDAGFRSVSGLRDLAGHARVVVGAR